MSRSYLLFMIGTLAASIFFYRVNALLSMVCLLVFIAFAYNAGKLG